MILDHHIPNGKPLIESDKDLLHVLCRIYYNGEIESMTKEPLNKPSPKQVEMFKTATTTNLFTNDDISAEKQDGKDIDTK